MDARDIIQDIGRRYADMKSYQDVGTLSITKGGSDKHDSLLDFKTYFKRPCSFRFETTHQTQKNDSRFVLWCDGTKVARSSNGYTQQMSEHFVFHNPLKDLDRALTSVKEAQPIACLLLEKLSGQRLTALKSVKMAGEETHNGELCYHIKADDRGEFTDVWITKAHLTVVKLIEKSLISGTDETIKVGSQPKFSKRMPLIYEYNFQNVWIDESIPSALFQIPAK